MEVLADTPAKSVGSPLFTSENAREMNRRAVEARRQNKLAEQERILSLEQQVKTVQPLLAKAVAETLEPRNSFVATRLRIAREQLCQLDEQLSQATDPKAIKAICDSIRAISEVERVLDGRPSPGSRRPGREKPSKASASSGPLDAE